MDSDGSSTALVYCAPAKLAAYTSLGDKNKAALPLSESSSFFALVGRKRSLQKKSILMKENSTLSEPSYNERIAIKRELSPKSGDQICQLSSVV